MARILQVCNTEFYLAGFLDPLIRALRSEGHAVECACEGNNIGQIADRLGIAVHWFGFPKSASPAAFVQAIKRMHRLIRAGGYECVNGHNRNASIVARVAAWMAGVPVNLYTAHGFYFHDAQSQYQREATIRFEGALARITTYTLSQSEEDARLMVSRGFIAPHRIAVIGNGIDTRRFRRHPDPITSERQLGLRSRRFRVAAVGRLVKDKGFADLLAAFTRLHEIEPDSELLLIGGNIDQDISPVHQEFLAQAREAGVADALTITGMVGEVEKYLSTSDVFVLPSHREGMPRALLEAMSIELPVIATAVRGCREIIEDGVNGLLYPPGDVDRLTGLLRLLHGQPRLRVTFGQAARDAVVHRFDERQYVARQVQAIHQLLGAPAPMPTFSSAGAG